MEQKVQIETKIVVSALFLTPIAIYCFYIGIKIMTMPTTVVEPDYNLVSRLSLAIFPLALGIFLSFMLVKIFLYIGNFEMNFDSKSIKITTSLGKYHEFIWEDIKGKEALPYGNIAIILKNGERIKLKYGYLKNIEAFWHLFNQKVNQA